MDNTLEESGKGLFVTATDTEVGKTFFSGLFLHALFNRGIEAGYFKPLASGCRLEKGALISEDLRFIENFTGREMVHDLHCPVRYERPLAPLAAAQLENKPVDFDAIWKSFDALRGKYPFLVVEGIGGLMVPLEKDYLVIDMIAQTKFPAVLICRPSLGTINHSLLSLRALEERDIPVIGFITNGYTEKGDEAALTSPGLIAEFSKVPYLGHIPAYDLRQNNPETFISEKAAFLSRLLM